MNTQQVEIILVYSEDFNSRLRQADRRPQRDYVDKYVGRFEPALIHAIHAPSTSPFFGENPKGAEVVSQPLRRATNVLGEAEPQKGRPA